MIIVGQVLESPCIGDLDGRFGTKHRIAVLQLIKGDVPAQIELQTSNGCYEVQVGEKREVQCISGYSEPLVPETSTVAVFFLRSGTRFSTEGSGMIVAETEPESGERFVEVSIRWPEMLDEDGHRMYEAAKNEGWSMSDQTFRRRVLLSGLKTLVQQVEAAERHRTALGQRTD